MITSIFFLIGALILSILNIILSAIAWITPTPLQESITWIFSYIHIFDFLFNMPIFMRDLIYLIGGLVGMIFIWVITVGINVAKPGVHVDVKKG